MPTDAGHGSSSATDGSILPPVLTRSSGPRPPAPAHGEAAVPPIIAGSGRPAAAADDTGAARPAAPADPAVGAPDETDDDAFPIDAFIVPEEVEHRPLAPAAGADPAPATASTTADVADRLERLARRIRAEGEAAIQSSLAGKGLEALLAGVIAGYLAARDD